MKAIINSKSSMKLKSLFYLVALLFVFATASASSVKAQGFGVSPGRIELEVKPGAERTTVLTVDYGKEEQIKDQPNIRVIARAEDWGLKPDGELLTAPAGTQPRSATNWLIFSPAEFTIAPGTKQTIRLTISVPAGTKPGDYYTAVYLEDRNPPPPPQANNPQINIRYRFYSLIYVMVPELTRRGEITNLVASAEEGKTVVNATLKNTGNSHIRGIHSVEIKNEADQTVAEIPRKEATVLLGDSEMTLQLALDKRLPAGKYKVVYSIDFGKTQSVLVGKTMLEITGSENAAAANGAGNSSIAKEPVTISAESKTSGSAAATPAAVSSTDSATSQKKP